MINPWLQLPTEAPFVLPEDRQIIDAFNERYADKLEFVIQTKLYPEPFVGDPNAPVYVLLLNPGYSNEDELCHKQPDFARAISNNLRHRPAEYPFYYLDPEFTDVPGSKWWKRKTRWFIDHIEPKLLAKNLFLVELWPYHSKNFGPIRKLISSREPTQPSCYAAHLIRKAIESNKPIVVTRALKDWCVLVPELENYPKRYSLNSPQNVALSPNNLTPDRYLELLQVLQVSP